MDPIDEALLEAWGRVAPAVRRDRLEALRRSFRRTRPLLARPIRPWCLCLRASDTRLRVHAWVPKYLPEQHEPHEITIFSDTIRELCKPVTIPWPGWDWERAAYALGRHPESLRSWIKRGVFRVRYVPAPAMGKQGKPVPEIWSPSPLDPNAEEGRAPNPLWGTLWQSLWEHVPDDLEFEVEREPVWRAYPGDRSGRRRFMGWQWVCPGIGQSSTAARQHSSACETDEARGGGADCPVEPVGKAGEERAPTSRLAPLDSPEEGGVWGGCGRRVNRLYMPLRVWTVMDAMEFEDPLEVSVPLVQKPGRAPGAEESQRAGVTGDGGRSEDVPNHACAKPRHGEQAQACHPIAWVKRPRLACRVCHQLHYSTLMDRNAWNRFVAHLSAGLLYGYEVKKPPGLAAARRRRFVSPRRADAGRLAARRERVLRLLASGLTRDEAARRVGVALGTVKDDIRRLYREHGVRTRRELIAKVRNEAARPGPVGGLRTDETEGGMRAGAA